MGWDLERIEKGLTLVKIFHIILYNSIDVGRLGEFVILYGRSETGGFGQCKDHLEESEKT